MPRPHGRKSTRRRLELPDPEPTDGWAGPWGPQTENPETQEGMSNDTNQRAQSEGQGRYGQSRDWRPESWKTSEGGPTVASRRDTGREPWFRGPRHDSRNPRACCWYSLGPRTKSRGRRTKRPVGAAPVPGAPQHASRPRAAGSDHGSPTLAGYSVNAPAYRTSAWKQTRREELADKLLATSALYHDRAQEALDELAGLPPWGKRPARGPGRWRLRDSREKRRTTWTTGCTGSASCSGPRVGRPTMTDRTRSAPHVGTHESTSQLSQCQAASLGLKREYLPRRTGGRVGGAPQVAFRHP